MRLIAAFILLAGFISTAPAAEVLVVCPQQFKAALSDWVEYRKEQGHEIKFIPSKGTDKEIKKRIKNAYDPDKEQMILIVGDALPLGEINAKRSQTVATHYIPAKVNIHWGPEKEIATDNFYADMDDDGLPELPIGRIPIDTREEMEAVIHKILHYEENPDFGEWRRRINFVACPGDFGGVIDSILEQGSRRLTTAGIPASFTTTATYGSWRSPYCPDPRRFLDVTLNRLNEGSLFWIYIGHGRNRMVDRVETPNNQKYPILRTEDVGSLRCESGHPIAIFLACYTGRFDDAEDSLSEEMFKSQGGPVAIYSATRVTMPYAMAVMGTEMMKAYFTDHSKTLGELVLKAKRQMILAERSDPTSKSLDGLARAVNPLSPDLLAERQEHVQLFHLFGDPLLRLPHPSEVVLEAIGPVKSGSEIIVKGTTPVAGNCLVELIPPRDKLTFKPAPRPKFTESEQMFADLQSTYEKANQTALASVQADVKEGGFETTLKVPDSASGTGHIRVYVNGKKGYALGHQDLTIDSAPAKN